MYEVLSTLAFDRWLSRQKGMGKARILARIRNMEEGNFGDCKPVGEGVSESRIHWGPGLRLYFAIRGERLIVLLAGGDKASQQHDIERARQLARTI